jgi:hypothetical protein
MAKAHTFSIGFRVIDGRMQIDRGAVNQAVSTWPDCEGTLTLDTEEKRSNQANRYLFGVIYRDIEEATGQDKETTHDEMCTRFLTKTIHYTNPATSEVVQMEVVGRTSAMKVSEFHRFVEQVKLFAAEFFGLTFEDAPEEFYKERDRALSREKGRAA